jgi:acetyl-CoA C-acetyltransferase
MRARRDGVVPAWTSLPVGVTPTRVFGGPFEIAHPAEQAVGVGVPIRMYALFETAVRAARGETVDEHQTTVAELWSRFSSVAAKNPHAWSQRELTPTEIRTPTAANRMVNLPYTKYMNSNNDVDMAAAVILCSLERARALGVPDDRIVFVHAGTDASDSKYVSNRADLHSSPAVRHGGARALELAGLGIDDVDVIDLYSCFPSAVQIGAEALGLSLDRQLTRTGGLSFAGGPWNNYSMHAIATVVDDVRERPAEPAFVWANGGFAAKHAFGVYATTPPANGFRHEADAIQAIVDALPPCELAEGGRGAATIEAYTVSFARSGEPEGAFAACCRADGRRAWARSDDATLAAAMTHGEWVGQPVRLGDHGELRPVE